MNSLLKNPLLILYGSRAKGYARDNSDYDIGVFAGRDLSLEELCGFVAQAAGKLTVPEDRIDIADLAAASPLLVWEAMKNGRLISGEEEDYQQFKIRAWRQYLDTAKLRRARRVFLEHRLAQHA